jgi:hypothetical protein
MSDLHLFLFIGGGNISMNTIMTEVFLDKHRKPVYSAAHRIIGDLGWDSIDEIKTANPVVLSENKVVHHKIDGICVLEYFKAEGVVYKETSLTLLQ